MIARQVIVAAGVAAALLLIYAPRADAYPQFQLSRDQTCTDCHVSPAGGTLLTENGMNTAEAMSQFGTAPEFFYNKVPTPSWLELGGDIREQQGYLRAPQDSLLAFPMQADLYANATYKGFSLRVTAGYRPPEFENEAATYVWSREHYLMWQSDPGGTEGLYVRVGRFMPVFGLRFAEHVDYTRQYGGTPLYGETYGAAVEYVTKEFEAHLTGFVKDPLIDPVVHSNGGAAYAEYRITPKTAVGAEGMIAISPDDKVSRGGLTAKQYFPGPDIVVEGEVQLVHQLVDLGGHENQIVAYVLGSWFATKAIMVDLGGGEYDEDIKVRGAVRDCIDMNLHWFVTSHFEAVLNTRFEFFPITPEGQTSGGLGGGWVLLQGHYRL